LKLIGADNERVEKKDKSKLATIHRFSAGDGQHARSLQEIFASFTIAREISALA
jgi:hypothetical protein